MDIRAIVKEPKISATIEKNGIYSTISTKDITTKIRDILEIQVKTLSAEFIDANLNKVNPKIKTIMTYQELRIVTEEEYENQSIALKKYTYTPGNKELYVTQNGILLYLGDSYLEVSTNKVDFIEDSPGIEKGDNILFVIFK